MQPGSLMLVGASQSSSRDWREPRERRNGGRRRAEDATPTAEDLGAGPSLSFLTQVVSQVRPAHETLAHPYENTRRWRCGVCADEIA